MVYPQPRWNCNNLQCDSFDTSTANNESRTSTHNDASRQRPTSMFETLMSPFMSCVAPPMCGTIDCMIQQPLLTTAKTTPHENDVLCGRGNNSSYHKGNCSFRELVAANKKMYTTLTKKEKMLLARQIVDCVHHADPPGRFLARDTASGKWCDVGLSRSLEKTSQALRTKSSGERKQQRDVSSTTSGSSSAAEDSTTKLKAAAVAPSRNTTHSAKSVQPPKLTIPKHLQGVYRTKPKTSTFPHGVYPRTTPPVLPVREYHPRPYATPVPLAQYAGGHAVHPQQQRSTPDRFTAYPVPMSSQQQCPDYLQQPFTPQRDTPHHPTAVVTPQLKQAPLSPIAAPRSSCNPIQSPRHLHDWKRRRTSSDATAKIQNTSMDGDDSILNTSSARILNADPLTAPGYHSWSQPLQDTSIDEESSVHLNTSTGSGGLSSIIESKLKIDNSDPVFTSPSQFLQSYASRRRSVPKVTSALDQSADSMDGLAALSAAAFLRLDESYED